MHAVLIAWYDSITIPAVFVPDRHSTLRRGWMVIFRTRIGHTPFFGSNRTPHSSGASGTGLSPTDLMEPWTSTRYALYGNTSAYIMLRDAG